MAAILWPAFEKPMAAQRLRKSGDQIRAAWTSARVAAMSTGLVQSFRYQPGTGDYRVEPWECQETDTADGAGSVSGGGAPPALESSEFVTGPPVSNSAGVLPEFIHFVADQIVEDARSQFLQGGGQVNVINNTADIRPANGQDGAGAAGASGQPWSTPILFYPDGTTSTASVLLENQHGRQITVSLRGLTGVATLVED
jgi:Tfp pilus assembly protein FimT